MIYVQYEYRYCGHIWTLGTVLSSLVEHTRLNRFVGTVTPTCQCLSTIHKYVEKNVFKSV